MFGFTIGALLGISPVALPSIPAVVTVLTPTRVGDEDHAPRLAILGAVPVVAAFVAGHTAVLLAAAAASARFIGSADPDSPRWARLDRVVGFLFLAAAAYYVFRVASGTATTILPGEPGGLLP